jgi:hypothetical protein
MVQATIPSLVSVPVAALTGAVLKGMFMSKVKVGIAVLLVLSVIGVGVGTGSYKLLADEKGDTKKAERKEPAVRTTKQAADDENADGRLPTGESPRQALVSVVQSRRLLVKTQHAVAQPIASVTPDRGKVTAYRLTDRMDVSEYNLSDINVLENTGKGPRKVEKGRLSKLLTGEIHALVYSGPVKLDPLHLRFIKEGTLIVVLPYPSPVVPPPVVDLPLVPIFTSAFPAAPVPAPPGPDVPLPQDNEKGRRQSGQAAQPEARLGDIRIVGNEKTSDDVILKAIPFSPGEILSDAGLRKAERNLKRLNLFERAAVTVIESPGDYKDVLVTVKEK